MLFRSINIAPNEDELAEIAIETKNLVFKTGGGGCGAISYNETNSYTGKGCFKIKGCIEKQVINYVSEILKKDIK